MFLPNALLKALAQVRPEAAMAEGSGAVWTMQVNGNHPDGSPFITAMFTYAGGVGARATKPWPERVFVPDRSVGGADRSGRGLRADPIPRKVASARFRWCGAQIGGLGQAIEFSVDTDKAWQLNAVTSRLADPPLGVFGGESVRPAASSSMVSRSKRRLGSASAGIDVISLELPGGGGYGAAE